MEVTNTKKGKKGGKFSYSKVNTYESCGWKYYLTYHEKHYIYNESINVDFGILIHHIEESIGKALKEGMKPDYGKLKDEFLDINVPKKDKFDTEGGIFGVNILKKKYPLEFFATNDRGQSYATKAQDYLEYGIYRLETYMKENPDLEVYDLEKYFSISFGDNVLSGFIDRIFHRKGTNEYIIEDIKTKDKPFKDEDLTTPLQFVIYAIGLQNVLGKDISISCAYDLPILDRKQEAGSGNFIKRGKERLEHIFAGIDANDFEPHPSPLCAWCPFSPTNENQPEEGKNLCPYYSLWTRGNRTFKVAHKWEGMDRHPTIMKEEKLKKLRETLGIDFDF